MKFVRASLQCCEPRTEQLRENCDLDLEKARRLILPLVNSSAGVLPSQCQRFDVDWNFTDLTCDNLDRDMTEAQRAAWPTTSCKNGWEYDYEGRESFVTEWLCGDVSPPLPAAALIGVLDLNSYPSSVARASNLPSLPPQPVP
ncbi:hypothetical protein AOLI_G00034360 [Acnodon oligacanthus]